MANDFSLSDSSTRTLGRNTLVFALACGIGLVGAWIGLGHHSFWYDELAVAIMIGDGHSLREVLARVTTDITPPLYFIVLYGFTKLFGIGDVALRAFSALCACLSIVVFVVGTRRNFSVAGRLFAGAIATGSYFWFFQSQTARFYTISMALSAVVLALALSLLRSPPQEPRRGVLAALATVLLLGTLVHYYFTIEGLAVLGVLFLYRPRERLLLCLTGGALVAATLLYLHFVVTPNVQIDPKHFYIPNRLDWYVAHIHASFHKSLGRLGTLAIALCLAAIAVGWIVRKRHPTLDGGGSDVLIAGVPLLVLAGGIGSSILLSPNFTDRNLLICSPFLWALWARLYDWAVAALPDLLRAGLDIVLGLTTLWMASIVLQRTSPGEQPNSLWSEPFRQSAEWIRSVPACRGAMIPVIVFDEKSWYRGDYAQWLYSVIYGHYLQGYATTQNVQISDIDAHRIDPAMADEMRARLDGRGCPVIGWTAHGVYALDIPVIRKSLLAALDQQDTPADGMVAHEFRDGWWGVVYAARRAP